MLPPRRQTALGWKMSLPFLFMLAMNAPVWPNGAMETPGNPKTGRDLFVRRGCMRCHSMGESSERKAPSLASVGMGRNLYELCATMWSHWSQMNAMRMSEKQERNPLTAGEFRDIIAYLYYLNYCSETGDAALGQEVFLKKGCSQCHALEPLRSAKKSGRPVYEMGRFQAPVNLAVAVWNHGTSMIQSISKERMRWPEFQDREVADLVAFLRSRNAAPPETDMVLPGDPSRGQGLLRAKSCVFCHNPGVPSATGPDFAASGRAASLSALMASLWNHYPKMSKALASSGVLYSKIEMDEMADILAYVYWLKATGLRGNSTAGRDLYQSKQCATCHSPAGAMPPVGPSLVRSQTTESAYALLAAIWNHGPQMESALRERSIPWPSLNGDELRDLVAYFRK